jgi:nicotinamide-nucleotide amidase
MHAAILSIGDELTVGQNLNTNSQWLADELGRCGVMTVEHRTVDDDPTGSRLLCGIWHRSMSC